MILDANTLIQRDDIEEDEDLREDVINESPLSQGEGLPKKKAPKGKGKGKRNDEEVGEVRENAGKGREGLPAGQALHLTVEDEDEDSDDKDDEESGPLKKKPGRWPNEALEMCEKLGICVAHDAKQIAEKFGKDVGEVIMRAGLGFQYHKSHSQWQMFQAWYNHMYEKPKNGE